MNVRRVAGANGWLWIVQAFRLARKKPLGWLAIHMLLLVMVVGMLQIPVIGAYALCLLTPVFLGGLMTAAKDIEAGRNLPMNAIFRGFHHRLANLVTIGGVYLVGQVLISGTMLAVGGPEFRQTVQTFVAGGDPASVSPEAASHIMSAMLVGMALMVPLMMAMCFAPALVMLDELSGWRAMQWSLRASLANLLPLTLYSMASTALLMIALIPRGAGLVLWLPLMGMSLFTSYRDVFADQAN